VVSWDCTTVSPVMLPARLREAGYVPGANRVSMHGEHDWDSSCRLLSGLRFGRTDRKYDIDFQADDLTCELAKSGLRESCMLRRRLCHIYPVISLRGQGHVRFHRDELLRTPDAIVCQQNV
jgi:hypothetical protein